MTKLAFATFVTLGIAAASCSKGDGKEGGAAKASITPEHVAAVNALLPADLKSKIEAIPPPFRTAITEHPDEVAAAYASARAFKRELATEVVSVLGSTLRFNDADGD